MSIVTSAQPKTFAPSRDDVLTTLAYFFGAPVSPEKLIDYNEHHAQTYHFPDAYYGANTRLRDTLNNLILKSPQSWQTTIGLPFVSIEGTVVEWDEIHFDVRLMQRVPYEGVSRMQTSLRRRHRDRVVRRGLGLLIESDFYATEAGRKHFTDQLTSIRYCVQETCNFDVLFSYLTCGNYDFRYDLAKGLRPRRSIKTAMSHEIMFYGIAQKDDLGLDRAVEECKYRMSRYGVAPNMMVIPPQLGLYLAMAPEPKTLYTEGGDKAVTQFEAGYAGFTSRPFRGLNVVTSEPFEVSDDQDSVQMLTRNSQVGEFYIMGPPEGKIEADSYGFMDILIYDEEADRHVRIKWEHALAATLMVNSSIVPDAEPIYDKPKTMVEDDLTANTRVAWYDAAMAWQKANERQEALATGVPLDGANTTAAMTAKEVEAYWREKAAKANVYIVIARPFIEHMMHSAVVAVGGKDTGATLFGPADMQISANTQVKTIEGHYTGHFKSVITKPQNVFVARDIACGGYVAGGNCKFFAEVPGVGFSKDALTKNLQDRLGFANDDGKAYGSLLAFPLPKSQYESGQMDTVMSISSRMLPWDMSTSNSSFPGGERLYSKYAKANVGLNTIHYGEDTRAAENMEYVSQGSVNNALCFIGPHRKWNTWSASHVELVPGQGHFGPDAVPGDARWRRGEVVSLKAARDHMKTYEAAAHAVMNFK